jgi:DNA adenine methylase
MRGLSLVQWVGGKGLQLDDLLPFVPYTQTYVEPFGGGASILLNRRRSPVEVYNDLNGDVVNLFRVMRSNWHYPHLEEALALTMFSKAEFAQAINILTTEERDVNGPPDVMRAWAIYVVQNMGISGKHAKSVGNWSRSKQDSKNTSRWWGRFDKLAALHERLRDVQIDHQDAIDCMVYWDSPDTTFYVDPPYVLSTRDAEYYEHEMDDETHGLMVRCLLELEGAVVLSGYDHEVYEPLVEAGWRKDVYGAAAHTKISGAGVAKPRRVECVWRNELAVALGEVRSLF